MEMIDELLAMAEEDGVTFEDDMVETEEDEEAIKEFSDSLMRDIGELTDPSTSDTVVLSFEELQQALELAKAKAAEKKANQQ